MLTWYACGSAAHQSMPRKAVPIDLLEPDCLGLSSLCDVVSNSFTFSVQPPTVSVRRVDSEAQRFGLGGLLVLTKVQTKQF